MTKAVEQQPRAGGAPATMARWRFFEDRQARIGFLLVLPALVLILVISFGPLVEAISLSFHYKHALAPQTKFVGLANYLYLLNQPAFWNALTVGIIYTVSTVGLQLVLGIAIALLFHQSFVGRNLARGFILFPYMLPGVVAVVTWRWMLNDVYGVVQYLFLDVFHIISEPITYSGDRVSAMVLVVLVSVWRFFPFVTLCALARLQAIPLELYDAAKVDGANAWQRFRHITLPQLRGIIYIILLLRGIWMFNEFDTIWLLTRGEPYHSTETMPLFAYITSFVKMHLGRGSAISVISLVFLVLVYLIYLRAYRVEEDE